MAEIAAVSVVDLNDRGIPDPGMREDAASRGIPEILQPDALRCGIGDAVENPPGAAAMHRRRIGIVARLGANQHMRGVTETAQRLVDAPRRPCRAALAVRCREMDDIHALSPADRRARNRAVRSARDRPCARAGTSLPPRSGWCGG